MKTLVLLVSICLTFASMAQTATNKVVGNWTNRNLVNKTDLCTTSEGANKWYFRADGTYKVIIPNTLQGTSKVQTGKWKLENNTLTTTLDPMVSGDRTIPFNPESFELVWTSDDCFHIEVKPGTEGGVTLYRGFLRMPK